MDTQEAKTKLDMLIRTSCPIIGIETVETRRVIEALVDLVETDSRRKKKNQTPRRKLFTFSVSRGLHQVATYTGELGETSTIYDEVLVREPMPDPAFAAYDITQYIYDEDAPVAEEPPRVHLYVLKDVHAYFDNPLLVRGLRDLAEALVDRHQTVILVSPALDNLPNELRKDIKVLAWPLPGVDELGEQVEAFVANLDRTQVDLNGRKGDLIEALRGLTVVEADQVLAESVIAHGVLDERAIEFTVTAKAEIIRASGALEFYPPETDPNDVGGMDRFKDWLRKAGKTTGPAARDFGLNPARGVLVAGVPGCGKSLLAKAMSKMWNVPVLKMDFGAMYGPLVGQSESQTRNAFRLASAIGKCILWWDELEKGMGSQGGERDGGTSQRVLFTALTWMEEDAAKAGVFIYATANEIEQLRPELLRRFTALFFVDLPSGEDRRDILRIHIRKTGRDPLGYGNLDTLVDLTAGFTGSECETVVQDALWTAFDEGRDLTVADLEAAAAATEPLSKTMEPQIEHMRRWADKARPVSSRQTTGKQGTPARLVSQGKSRSNTMDM